MLFECEGSVGLIASGFGARKFRSRDGTLLDVIDRPMALSQPPLTSQPTSRLVAMKLGDSCPVCASRALRAPTKVPTRLPQAVGTAALSDWPRDKSTLSQCRHRSCSCKAAHTLVDVRCALQPRWCALSRCLPLLVCSCSAAAAPPRTPSARRSGM